MIEKIMEREREKRNAKVLSHLVPAEFHQVRRARGIGPVSYCM
jgi:hypothetical protein